MAYHDAVRINLAEITGERPLYAFLDAVETIYADWVGRQRIDITTSTVLNEPLVTMEQLIREFRVEVAFQDLRQMINYHQSRQLHPTTGTSRAKTLSDFVCGCKHRFIDCPYLDPTKRPANWRRDPSIQAKVDNLECHGPPKLRSILQSIISEVTERTVTTTAPAVPDIRLLGPLTLVTSCYASLTTKTISSDSDIWFLDSGSPHHITNNASIFTAK